MLSVLENRYFFVPHRFFGLTPYGGSVCCNRFLLIVVCIRKKPLDWVASSVIRLGLEPRTPTLKVLCSTCWASESSLCFSLKAMQRYDFNYYLPNFITVYFVNKCKCASKHLVLCRLYYRFCIEVFCLWYSVGSKKAIGLWVVGQWWVLQIPITSPK